MKDVQFIRSADGEPIFAVLPIAIYHSLRGDKTGSDLPKTSPLLSADGRYVRLPNAGPNFHLDVLQLVDLFWRRGTTCIAIAQRAQTLDKFDEDQVRNGLDPLIRRLFLPESSPYRNTMQASNEVVDALVETGIFEPTMARFPAWYRPVKSLNINIEALQEFIQKHGPLDPKNQIDIGEVL
jgi:hypothetical protein